MQLCKHPPNKAKTLKIMTFHCWPLCKFNAIIAALESVWSITKNYCYSLELSHKTIKQWASVNKVTYNFSSETKIETKLLNLHIFSKFLNNIF